MAEIPKIVSQRLHAAVGDGIHPDPDLITAFVEKSLRKPERVQVLEHLSRCTSCREMVALSATQPDVAGAVSVVPASTGWLSWPVLRWGAALACVIVVGAAVTLRHQPGAPQVAPTLSERKPAAEAQTQTPDVAIAKKAASTQLPDQQAKTAFVAEQPGRPGQASPNNPATQPALVAGAAPAPSGLQMFAAPASRQQERTPNPAVGKHAVTSPSPVEMADAGNGSPMAEVVPGRAKAASPEPQDQKAGKAISGGTLSSNETVEVSGAALSVAGDAVISTNLAPRWTLSSDGTLQRSLDSGGTWQTIHVSHDTVFRALAANGLDIWVGGSAGALFHSSDAGQHWTQVRPVANGKTLTDDIIGVEFTDLLHGKLTSSSAESWVTADAGQTWQRQ